MDNITKNLIRIGRVSAINPAKATVRVDFQAHGVISYDLPVLQKQTLKNKDYCLPDVGEYVVCIFLPTGNAEGFVLGSIYKDTSPPENNLNKRVIQFEDGTRLEYDRETNTLTIDSVGAVNIHAKGSVTISGDDIVNLSAMNGITIESSGGVQIIGKTSTGSW